jgi:hypothetical protein
VILEQSRDVRVGRQSWPASTLALIITFMNVLDFKESLIMTLERVPKDADVVLGSAIIIPVIRNGSAVGEIRILETETGYFARKPG